MWKIERAKRGRWTTEPGPTYETREDAQVALQTTVLRELRKITPGRWRTDRFRIALASVAACLVLQ